MSVRPNFPAKVKLAAWQRAGGPDNPLCECGCSQPITKSDPAEYHHIEEAESGDTEDRRKYLKSLDNCLCVRRSCHKRITKTETMPKIVKSRRQREGEANIQRTRSSLPGGRASGWKRKIDGTWVKR